MSLQELVKNNILQSLGLAILLALLDYLGSNQELSWRTALLAIIGAVASWWTTHDGKAQVRVQAQQSIRDITQQTNAAMRNVLDGQREVLDEAARKKGVTTIDGQ